jgi:hypothetical protein
MPSGRSGARHLPGPCGERMDDRLSALPHAAGLGQSLCASRLLPAFGRTCGTGLHPLPYERRAREDPLGLLFVPRRQLSDGARSRGEQLSAHVSTVSQHHGLAPGALRSHRVLPDGRPRQPGLHALPHRRHVRAASDELLLLSCGGLSEGAESHGPQLSADVPAVSFDNRLDAGHVPTSIPLIRAPQSSVHDLSYDRQHQHLQLFELPHSGQHKRAPLRRGGVQLRLASVLSMSSDRTGGLRQV